MKVIVSVVKRTLEAGGHDVSLGRTSGDLQADISKRARPRHPVAAIRPAASDMAPDQVADSYRTAAKMPAAATRSSVPSFSAWAS